MSHYQAVRGRYNCVTSQYYYSTTPSISVICFWCCHFPWVSTFFYENIGPLRTPEYSHSPKCLGLDKNCATWGFHQWPSYPNAYPMPNSYPISRLSLKNQLVFFRIFRTAVLGAASSIIYRNLWIPSNVLVIALFNIWMWLGVCARFIVTDPKFKLDYNAAKKEPGKEIKTI